MTIDTALAFQALGARGRARGSVTQLGFNLVPAPVTIDGELVPAAIAYGSPVNLQAVSAGRWVATGDFAVPGPRVDPILDALAAHDIVATAVHSHLIGESPTLYYIHFWADGAPGGVLRGLRAAIDAARRGRAGRRGVIALPAIAARSRGGSDRWFCGAPCRGEGDAKPARSSSG